VKQGIFVGMQIREVMFDENFKRELKFIDFAEWKFFMSLVRGFLGNKKEENYLDILQSLLRNYHNLGCLMSLKIRFLHSLLSFFPEKLGAVSVRQAEQFDQGKAKMEQRYQEWSCPAVMGNYSLFLRREAETSHTRVK